MTATLTAPTTNHPRLSTKNKIGLVLCGLLGVADIAGLGLIGQAGDGQQGPPASVLIACAVLGVITLVAMVTTWRSGNRRGSRIIAAARILSALSSLPAFFLDDVSAALVATAGGGVVVTLIAVWLLLSRPAG